MKAILISIHPQWVELILNLIKKDEIRKGSALYKAINRLIEEQGVAPCLMYCTKDNKHDWYYCEELGCYFKDVLDHNRGWEYAKQLEPLNGKVIARYNATAEIINCWGDSIANFSTKTLKENELEMRSCLSYCDLFDYLAPSCSYEGYGDEVGTAVHIHDLQVFDKPKELSEFEHQVIYRNVYTDEKRYIREPLRKAPQSWCYVEV